MAKRRATNNRLGTAGLMLLALPFAAIGVGALGWALFSLVEWQRVGGWVPVQAELTSVALEERRGDDSTTYEVTATYRYEVDGTHYTSDRVAIDSGADNIGDFQQRVYGALRAAHANRAPVTAYVNSADPNEAVLNRELRLGLLSLKCVFALVFGGVGFGLLINARHAGRKQAAERALREQFPAEPWRWKPEWANGRIAGSTRSGAYAAIAFAVLWNAVSLPAAFFVPRELESGNTFAAVVLLFPLVGLGLAAWAVRAWLQLKRFKVAVLSLDRLPVALGGRLKGSIRVEAAVPVTSEFRLELACVEERTRGGGKNRRRTERLLWQKGWRVPRHQSNVGAAFTTIPVDVAVPADQPATTVSDTSDRIFWRLDATGECPGPDFWSRFELPVFATAGHSPAAPAEAGLSPARDVHLDHATLSALGIDYERLPQGGEAWTFRRGRHKQLALAVTAFAVGWTIATGIVVTANVPLVMAIVFSLLDALVIWAALSLWLTEQRVTLERGLLTLRRSGLVSRAPIEIPQQWIRAVRATRGMQAGNKLYYDLEVETADGTHTAAGALPDYDVASSLARHWAASATRP